EDVALRLARSFRAHAWRCPITRIPSLMLGILAIAVKPVNQARRCWGKLYDEGYCKTISRKNHGSRGNSKDLLWERPRSATPWPPEVVPKKRRLFFPRNPWLSAKSLQYHVVQLEPAARTYDATQTASPIRRASDYAGPTG